MFQASALVMADLRVLKDPAFLSVAMTAEQWVPLLQVPQRDLLPWLLNKQAQGYRCGPCTTHIFKQTCLGEKKKLLRSGHRSTTSQY